MNRDKMVRGKLAVGQANAIMGDVQNGIAIAGTTQATATAITAEVVVLTSGTGGARLPAPSGINHTVRVYNRAGATCKLYPHVGGKVNNGAANAELSLPTDKACIVTAVSATEWYSFPVVPT